MPEKFDRRSTDRYGTLANRPLEEIQKACSEDQVNLAMSSGLPLKRKGYFYHNTTPNKALRECERAAWLEATCAKYALQIRLSWKLQAGIEKHFKKRAT